jgi:hypothetical protein
MEYLRRDRGVREKDTQDLARFRIDTMLPGRLKVHPQSTNGTQIHGEWNVERCHFPGCRHLHAEYNQIKRDLETRPGTRATIEALGSFWGIIRRIIREKPRATIS